MNAIINFYSQNKLKTASFLPTDISNLEYWADFSDYSTLDIDTTSGTNTIYRVFDKSKNSFWFEHPTKARQPLVANDGKYYALGNSSGFTSIWGTASYSPYYTTISIIKYDSGNSGNFWPEVSDGGAYGGSNGVPFGSGAERLLQWRIYSNKDVLLGTRNPWFQGTFVNVSTIQDTNIHLLIGINNDTLKQVWYDNTKIAEQTTGSSDTSTISQVSALYYTDGGSLNYRLYEQFRYNKALDTADLSRIYTYFQNKYT